MSNYVNEQWLNRAAECIAFFEGKLPAELIQSDLDHDDWDSLQRHVLLAEAEMSIEYFAQEPNEFLQTDIY